MLNFIMMMTNTANNDVDILGILNYAIDDLLDFITRFLFA